jgi:predicted  nucleic acid-binding Zn-ribbon protein
MERRINALEEISLIAVQALQEFDVSMLRAEASIRRSQASLRELDASLRALEASVEEFGVAVRRMEVSVKALTEFVPVIQAEVIRLDDRINRIEGA